MILANICGLINLNSFLTIAMLMSLVSVFLISSSVNLVFTRRFNILHAVSGRRLLVNAYVLTYRLIEFTAVGRDEEDLEVLLHDCHPVFPFVSRALHR
jgi:hypothetical protein